MFFIRFFVSSVFSFILIFSFVVGISNFFETSSPVKLTPWMIIFSIVPSLMISLISTLFVTVLNEIDVVQKQIKTLQTALGEDDRTKDAVVQETVGEAHLST